jgi:putative flippase GtrA
MWQSNFNFGRIPQSVRYILIGGIVFCCDWLIFFVLVQFFNSASISNLASRTLAIPISFYLQRRFTFVQAHMQRTTAQLWRFLMLWALATASGALLLETVRVPFGANMAALIKLPLEIVIAFINYFAMKYWVYLPGRRDMDAS